MSHRVLFLLIVSAALALAAAPLATVTSSEPLILNGVTLGAGVPSTPIVSGDTLFTSAPAVLLFKDKSRLTLEKNSRVKLESDGDKVLVRLLEGVFSYKLAARSPLQFLVADQPVKLSSAPEGTLAVRGNQVVTGSSRVAVAPPPPAPPVSHHK